MGIRMQHSAQHSSHAVLRHELRCMLQFCAALSMRIGIPTKPFPLVRLQGVDNPKVDDIRLFSDRVIAYDVYNDLGKLPLDAKKDTFDPRPILGGDIEVRRGAKAHRLTL